MKRRGSLERDLVLDRIPEPPRWDAGGWAAHRQWLDEAVPLLRRAGISYYGWAEYRAAKHRSGS